MTEDPKPTPYRTVAVVIVLALFGGIVCVVVKGSFTDYAGLLKWLGFAAAGKSGVEHYVKHRVKKAGANGS